MTSATSKASYKKSVEYNKYLKRPEKLKSAREAYVRRTGGKLRPVQEAGMYKDMTDLEKKQYAALGESKPKGKTKRKTLLG